MSSVAHSSAAEVVQAVFTPLTPGWEHREDPCLGENFLGAVSQIQDKDVPLGPIWILGLSPLGQDAHTSYFSGDTRSSGVSTPASGFVK